MRVKHSTVIGILRRLETKGFLYCVVDEENKRCRNVILTQKGLDLKSEMEVHLREEEMRIRKALSEEESQDSVNCSEKYSKAWNKIENSR